MLSLFSSKDSDHRSLVLFLETETEGNTVYPSHEQIYTDLTVIKILDRTKFPVCLVRSKVTKTEYAMKLFLHCKRRSQILFANESRFASLAHSNIIKHLYFQDERKIIYKNTLTTASYSITEYASNGNFLNFIKNHGKKIDDKLVRTYFKQLISGLDYLHKSGVSHMNLKLGSLLLDHTFTLKIANFKQAHFRDDGIIIGQGTTLFRAPEVAVGKCKDSRAADIYSAGIILFIFKTRGVIPQFEDELIGGVNLRELLKNDAEKFWAYHVRESKAEFDEEFKELFESMTKFDNGERATIESIKGSKWYNGPVYTEEELESKMEKIFGL